MHTCPMVTPGTPPIPHVGGPITLGAATVMIGMMPAARMGDMCTCVGPPDTIAMGSPTVLIEYMMAARLGDPTIHGGVISVGFPTVMIGVAGSPTTPSSNSSGNGIQVANKGLAAKSAYDAAKLGTRVGTAAVQGAKHGQNAYKAGSKALLRGGSKLNPWLIGIGVGVSAYDGASNAADGEELQGAAKQVAKDNKYALGGAAVGAAIGAWGFGVGAIPGAAVGFTVGGIADAVSTLID